MMTGETINHANTHHSTTINPRKSKRFMPHNPTLIDQKEKSICRPVNKDLPGSLIGQNTTLKPVFGEAAH